jgi:ATP-dependent Clp protease ATP-binding subunit ClpB
VFHFLSRDDILKIVDIQVEAINERIAEKGFTLKLTTAARKALADHGYSPDFGARPLKRLTQKWLLDPLARLVIEGAIGEGDAIQVDWKEGAMILKKK